MKVKYTFMKLLTQFRKGSWPTATEIAWEQPKNICGQFSSDFSVQVVWASSRLEWGLLPLWQKTIQNYKWNCRFPGQASVRTYSPPYLFIFSFLSSHLNVQMNVSCNIMYVINQILWYYGTEYSSHSPLQGSSSICQPRIKNLYKQTY